MRRPGPPKRSTIITCARRRAPRYRRHRRVRRDQARCLRPVAVRADRHDREDRRLVVARQAVRGNPDHDGRARRAAIASTTSGTATVSVSAASWPRCEHPLRLSADAPGAERAATTSRSTTCRRGSTATARDDHSWRSGRRRADWCRALHGRPRDSGPRSAGPGGTGARAACRPVNGATRLTPPSPGVDALDNCVKVTHPFTPLAQRIAHSDSDPGLPLAWVGAWYAGGRLTGAEQTGQTAVLTYTSCGSGSHARLVPRDDLALERAAHRPATSTRHSRARPAARSPSRAHPASRGRRISRARPVPASTSSPARQRSRSPTTSRSRRSRSRASRRWRDSSSRCLPKPACRHRPTTRSAFSPPAPSKQRCPRPPRLHSRRAEQARTEQLREPLAPGPHDAVVVLLERGAADGASTFIQRAAPSTSDKVSQGRGSAAHATADGSL